MVRQLAEGGNPLVRPPAGENLQPWDWGEGSGAEELDPQWDIRPNEEVPGGMCECRRDFQT
eukprot:9881580-Prorocentrum_lima.AAC.1